jgi:hypothetical protein
LAQQILSAIDSVLQQNGISPPSQQSSQQSGQQGSGQQGLGTPPSGPPPGPPPGGMSFGNFSTQGSSSVSSSSGTSSDSQSQDSSISDFLEQNGVSVSQFREALYASAQNGSGSGVDLSQLFQNASSGQNVNVTA